MDVLLFTELLVKNFWKSFVYCWTAAPISIVDEVGVFMYQLGYCNDYFVLNVIAVCLCIYMCMYIVRKDGLPSSELQGMGQAVLILLVFCLTAAPISRLLIM
jgi:hypothetical protein